MLNLVLSFDLAERDQSAYSLQCLGTVSRFADFPFSSLPSPRRVLNRFKKVVTGRANYCNQTSKSFILRPYSEEARKPPCRGHRGCPKQAHTNKYDPTTTHVSEAP